MESVPIHRYNSYCYCCYEIVDIQLLVCIKQLYKYCLSIVQYVLLRLCLIYLEHLEGFRNVFHTT